MVTAISNRHANLSVLPTDDLKRRLVDALQVTVEKLVEVAAIVRELEERGEDLESLKIGMLSWFRRIAHGQVLPELFVRYQDHPKLLGVAASLPIPDQKRISEPCTLPVLVLTDGGATERQVDPLDMTSREIRQVFTRGAIRTLPQQRGFLEDSKPPANRAVQQLESGVTINKRRRSLTIGGVEVSRSQLLSYLSHFDD